ncbi:hypothetical protein F7725_008550 [Dissostichus mawsoni]|uniref:Uncharacterized protein n=1 Tax=Dissostichus mawsoni TaxID=36200 RepID=A0A7J5YA07_DISMA|nr:hypothetical protein F7725_008550 [Dissostichus mawsoni]
MQVYKKTKKNGKRRVFVDPNPSSCAAPSTRPASSIPREPPPLKKLKKRLKTQMNDHDYATRDMEPGSCRPPPARRPRRGPVSQTAFSVEMLRHRCPVTIFSVTNSLGLSMSKTTARIHVRKLAEENERTVKRWRDEIQTTRVTKYCSEDSKKAAAYTFSWGKVPSVSRSESTERGYSFVTWAFRFAHQARTYESLRQRMKTLVMRIIADNLTALKGPRGRVERHIPHKYSSLMKKQSTTVSLGAVIPNLTEESVSVAFGLKDFIPEVSGTPHHILCCGDVLSTERKELSNKTQNNETPKQNPELKLTDSLKLHQSFRRNTCSTRRLTNTAKDYFLNIWDFITMDWLRDLALRLVDLVWMPPSQEDINMAAAAAAEQKKPGERLVRCCSNLCPRIWFHESCVQTRTLSDQDEDQDQDQDQDQDRFCGPDCGSDGTYAYCQCKERRGGQMVQCGLMERCRKHEWYHRPVSDRRPAEQRPAQ